jgi:hypothetical protein
MEKLLRQRALLQEHLCWLESEIAAEAPSMRDRTPSQPSDLPAPGPGSAPAATPARFTAELAAVVPENDLRGIRDEVRSGCLIYFALAFAVLGMVVGFVYWYY